MNCLIPKNWDEFQHYKNRAPSWIKLHRGLLDNFEFHCLPVASRALAPMLWLLASEYEGGQIPLDFRKLAFRFRMSEKEVQDSVKPLIDNEFFTLAQPASEVLAECLPREEEGREREEGEGAAPATPPKRPRKKPETEIPENFEVSERVKAWAAENHFTDNRVSQNFAKFALWAKSKDKRYSDWDAALMAAIRDNWAEVNDAPPAQPAQSLYRQWRPQ